MNFYLKKILSLIATLFCVALISFLMFQIIPGDAAVAKLGTEATPEKLAELRAEYGYDQNVAVRFAKWLKAAVRGDFGKSIRYDTKTVSELIADRLPVTLGLAAISILLIVVISIPLGLVCAGRPGGFLDRISDPIAVTFMAIPSFVQGILVTVIFGLLLNAFTPGGYVEPSEDMVGFLRFMLFPALGVAIPKIAMTVRFMKSAVKEELGRDYVRTARAKGNTTDRLMWAHVFRNSLMPVVTFIGLLVAEVMAGSIMIEQVFNLPGMGRLLVMSITNRDFNVVQAIVMYIAVTVITVNMLVDIVYKLIDPRV